MLATSVLTICHNYMFNKASHSLRHEGSDFENVNLWDIVMINEYELSLHLLVYLE